ncbi:unnamed protein product [Ectocarpus sp. CCAP 1310/34]|nr:unnamed protein product [Ectocarpus sp. CCAP 1310/34]
MARGQSSRMGRYPSTRAQVRNSAEKLAVVGALFPWLSGVWCLVSGVCAP